MLKRFGNKPQLEIKDSVIYFTYTSFLNVENLDLKELAKKIISSRFAICVVNRYGEMYYRKDKGYSLLHIKTKNLDDGNASFEFFDEKGLSFNFEDNKQLFNCCYDACQKNLSETRIFSGEFYSENIRIYLDDIVVNVDDFRLTLNPELIVYEDGVVILKYKLISDDLNLNYTDFIDQIVNCTNIGFSQTWVSPNFCNMATIVYQYSQKLPFHERLKMRSKLNKHIKEVERLAEFQTINDIDVELINLLREDGIKEDLSSIKQTILAIISYFVSNPNRNFKYIVLGQKDIILNGDYWSGRPYIYLLDIDKNCNSSRLNNKKYDHEFSAILARVPFHVDCFNLKDLRPFSDISVFIEESAGLCVFSSSGNDRDNTPSFISNQELLNELLEYGYMIQKLMLSRSMDSKRFEEVLKMRLKINRLNTLENSTSFGECRDFLQNGWAKFGVDKLRLQVYEATEISKEYAQYKYTQQANIRNLMVMILFGLMAVPTVSKEVVKPIYSLLNLYIPPQAYEGLYYFLITMLIILPLVYLTYYLLIRKISL